MESLEKLIEKRKSQCEFSAMMIPRYLENPDAFLGSKDFTLEEAEKFKEEAEKCKAILDFLKNYNANKKAKKILNMKLDFIFNHKTQTELADIFGITQWELLLKIKDKTFSKKEFMLISKLYRQLYTGVVETVC